MASTSAYTIVLRSNNPDNMMQRVREAPAAAAITPGYLLEWNSGDVQAHSTAGGNTEGRKVALENPWSDHGSGTAIAHDYAADETVAYLMAQPGDMLYMLIADGENISKGDALQSDGAGALEAYTAPVIDETGGQSGDAINVEAIVGYAAEAVDNSAGGAVARIRVDIA